MKSRKEIEEEIEFWENELALELLEGNTHWSIQIKGIIKGLKIAVADRRPLSDMKAVHRMLRIVLWIIVFSIVSTFFWMLYSELALLCGRC